MWGSVRAWVSLNFMQRIFTAIYPSMHDTVRPMVISSGSSCYLALLVRSKCVGLHAHTHAHTQLNASNYHFSRRPRAWCCVCAVRASDSEWARERNVRVQTACTHSIRMRPVPGCTLIANRLQDSKNTNHRKMEQRTYIESIGCFVRGLVSISYLAVIVYTRCLVRCFAASFGSFCFRYRFVFPIRAHYLTGRAAERCYASRLLFG